MNEPVVEKVTVDIILDTEFNAAVGNFRIDPISIAMVEAVSGESFYMVSSEFNQTAALSHPFLPQNVLPKLPPMEERHSNAEILEAMKVYLRKIVKDTGANRVNIWAKNGGMGDFPLLNLWFNDELYPYMRSLGVVRTYFNDTQGLVHKAGGRAILDELPPLPEEHAHTALGDVLRERDVFLLCRAAMSNGIK